MNIAVTGAGGFIGNKIYSRLAKDNEVTYISHDVDLRDPETCLMLLKGSDRVFHFAANIGGIGYLTANAAQVVRDNLLIDINILEACRKLDVHRLFMPSSVCVYGERKGAGGWAEYMPTEPTNYYGWGKLMSEKAADAYRHQYGMDICIARFDTIYGNTHVKEYKEKVPEAMCRKIKAAQDGGAIEIWGDGKQVRQLLYVDDLVEAVIRQVERGIQGPLNLSGFQTTVEDIADAAIKVSGKTLTKKYDLSAPTGVLNRPIDASKAMRELGWEPKINIEEGIGRIYEAIR